MSATAPIAGWDDPGPPLDADAPGRPEQDVARELRLRPEPPRVTRISRKALIVAGAVATTGLGGALILALEPRDRAEAVKELYATGRSVPAEGVAALPRDYTGIPKLGPPLPGDLGPAMLRQSQRDGVPVSGATATPMNLPGPIQPQSKPLDPAVQQRRQERAAAIRSDLFAGRGGATTTAPLADGAAAIPDPDASATVAPAGAPVPAATPSSLAERRAAFVSAEPSLASGSPASASLIQAGTVIPAALLTSIRSDLPGQVIAQVTAPVFDSPTGRTLLIPQGAKLIGTYDADLAAGQSRLLLAWTRLLLPDGRSLDLGRMPAADAAGQAGLQDRVDHHWGGLFRAALISTLLGVGAQSGSSNDEGDVARALRDGASDSFGRTGRQVVDRELGRAPTLTIRPGFPVRVILTRDLELPPFEVR